MTSLERHISDLKKKAKELEDISKLQEKYPDLELSVSRWNTKRYSSKSANSKVDRYEKRRNCGCCDDSPIEIWPYIEDNGIRIYSSPAYFQVGEGLYSDYFREYIGWEKRMKKKNISPAIIKEVQKFIDQKK